MLDVIIVCPGRHGDILAALPIAWHLHTQRQLVGWVVTPEHAATLKGVGYVHPIQWPGHYMDGERAARELGHLAHRVLNLRVPGRKPERPLTDSFAREMWALAGLADKWDELPLILDKRSPDREDALAFTVLPSVEPILLLALSGHSSPFPHTEAVRTWAEASWPGPVVDLAGVQCERIYDLCGLFDRSALLIASDSAPLHLSYATGIPTIGLQTEKPSAWHGTPRRKHWIEAIRYSDVPERLKCLSPLLTQLTQPAVCC